MSYQSSNPSDGTLLKTFQQLTDAGPESALVKLVDQVMRAVALCFRVWDEAFVNKKLIRVASIDAPA